MSPIKETSGRPLLIALAMWLVLGLGAAHADLTIILDDDGQTRTIYLTSDEMAAVDDDGTFVFDAENEVVIMQTPQGTRRMTKEQLQALTGMAQQYSQQSQQGLAQQGDMMANLRAQAEASIQSLPEPQRSQAMKEIEKRFPDAAAADGGAKKFEPMDESRKIGEYQCDGYRVMQGDQQVGEMWVASLESLGIRKSDVAVIGKMRDFFAEIVEGSSFMDEVLDEFDTLDPSSPSFIGFPVMRSERDGTTMQSSTLISLDREPIDRAVFDAE